MKLATQDLDHRRLVAAVAYNFADVVPIDASWLLELGVSVGRMPIPSAMIECGQ